MPLTWPIGDGPDFKGVYDLQTGQVLAFERTSGGKHRAPVQTAGLDDPQLDALVGADLAAKLRDERPQQVTLLYGAKDDEHNHAIVLRDWLRDHL